mgnify:CR=1 FL=1
MSHRSLEDLLTEAGNPVELLRNSPAGPNVYPGVPPEFRKLWKMLWVRGRSLWTPRRLSCAKRLTPVVRRCDVSVIGYVERTSAKR